MPCSRFHCNLLLAKQQCLGNDSLSNAKFNSLRVWNFDRRMLVNDDVEAKIVAQLQHCQSIKVFIIQVKATLALHGSSIRWKAHDAVRIAATSSEGSTGEDAPHGCLSIKEHAQGVHTFLAAQNANLNDELAYHAGADDRPQREARPRPGDETRLVLM